MPLFAQGFFLVYTGDILWADLLLGFVAIVTLLLAVTMIAHIWIPVPYIPTPWKVCAEMVQMAGLKGSETVMDLGAGDGRLLIVAKKKYPGIRAIGYEFVPTVWLLGKFIIWRSGQTVDLRLGNVLTADLRDADCIFLYLIPSLMKKLSVRFDQELRPGTVIVSYAFQFHDRTPVEEKLVPWISGERKIRKYVW